MNLLRIDCSPFGETAISRLLTEEFVQIWHMANPGGEVIRRDLATAAIPVIDAAWVSANYTPKESRTFQQNQLLKLSTELIAELLSADEYVIGMPVHNWGPPCSFKLWVDQIITPLTKAMRPCAEKRATFVIAAGAIPGSAEAPKNLLVPWLRTLFGFLGLREMQFVLAQGSREMHSGRIDRATFIAPHLEAIRALFVQEQSPTEPVLR